MGKALLLLILGAGMILVQQGISAMENETVTQRNQLGFQEEVLAREIAMSAFNVAMGEIRAHQEDVYAAVAAFNGPDGAGRTGTYTSGKYAGGKYAVRAELQSGHSVKVIATGLYGGTDYTMHDQYRVPVLIAREQGLVQVSFIESQAGFCAAVFMQRYIPGLPPSQQPAPEMVYSANNRDRRLHAPATDLLVEAGTQINFFIGVDEDCSERYETTDTCEMRRYVRTHTFNPARYNHVHRALDVEASDLDRAREALWGLVEQHPADRQRWRVGWEDQHVPAWNRPDGTSPSNSVQALKRLGYDERGWPNRDALGYRTLRNYSTRPDFSDQVIDVRVVALSDAQMQAAREARDHADVDCGVTVAAEPTPEPPPSSPPPAEPAPSCPCSGSKKVYIMHRPPGNESNEQRICISENGLNGHKNHNDYVICRGS